MDKLSPEMRAESDHEDYVVKEIFISKIEQGECPVSIFFDASKQGLTQLKAMKNFKI